MVWRITFNIIGDDFDPNKINVDFISQNLPNEIAVTGQLKGQAYGYGSAEYKAPNEISRLEKFTHLADLFEPKLNELKKYGAENWWIQVDRLYSHQCNEELDLEELDQIIRLKCSLSYSA